MADSDENIRRKAERDFGALLEELGMGTAVKVDDPKSRNDFALRNNMITKFNELLDNVMVPNLVSHPPDPYGPGDALFMLKQYRMDFESDWDRQHGLNDPKLNLTALQKRALENQRNADWLEQVDDLRNDAVEALENENIPTQSRMGLFFDVIDNYIKVRMPESEILYLDRLDLSTLTHEQLLKRYFYFRLGMDEDKGRELASKLVVDETAYDSIAVAAEEIGIFRRERGSMVDESKEFKTLSEALQKRLIEKADAHELTGEAVLKETSAAIAEVKAKVRALPTTQKSAAVPVQQGEAILDRPLKTPAVAKGPAKSSNYIA